MEASQGQDRDAFVRRDIYRAGQAQKPYYHKQGACRVDIERDGAYVEAGEGNNRAEVFIPTQREFVTVNQRTPLLRRKATWFIIALLLVIIIGVAVGVAVHETRVNDDNNY